MWDTCIIGERFITAKVCEKWFESKRNVFRLLLVAAKMKYYAHVFFHSQIQYLISFSASTEWHILRIRHRIIVANKSNLPVFPHVFDVWHWSTNGAEMIEHSIYIPLCSNFAFEHTILLNTRVTLCEISRSLVDLFYQE